MLLDFKLLWQPQAPTLGSTVAASSAATSGSCGAGSSSSVVDRLLMRSIPRPSESSVFVGDVVAFHSPLSAAQEQKVSPHTMPRIPITDFPPGSVMHAALSLELWPCRYTGNQMAGNRILLS